MLFQKLKPQDYLNWQWMHKRNSRLSITNFKINNSYSITKLNRGNNTTSLVESSTYHFWVLCLHFWQPFPEWILWFLSLWQHNWKMNSIKSYKMQTYVTNLTQYTHWGLDSWWTFWRWHNQMQVSCTPLKFVLKVPIDDQPSLVQVMAWCQTGTKPLPEPMMTQIIDAHAHPYLQLAILEGAQQ